MLNKCYQMIASLIIFGILAGLSCCKDCPTCPGPDDEPVSDYDFFIQCEGKYTGLLLYNTKEKAITDYYPGPTYIRDYAVSANGSSFMFTTDNAFQPDSLHIYNVPGMDLVNIVDVWGYLEMSNSGKYIAAMNISDKTITFLDGTTFNTLFTDSGIFMSGKFLLDDSRFYTINENTNRINVYDMAGESLLTEIEIMDQEFRPALFSVQPIGHGERIYYMGGLYRNYYWASYYPEQDSIGIKYQVGSPYGEMEITPDESQLIFSDPYWNQEMTGSGSIFFADIARDRLILSLPCAYSISGHGDTASFNPRHFAVTPDGRYLLVTGEWAICAQIDLIRHEFVNISVTERDSTAYYGVWCQKLMN